MRVAKDKGLGDTIARVASATGIKKIVNSVSSDCGCDKRQAKLNKIIPYGRGNKKNNSRSGS